MSSKTTRKNQQARMRLAEARAKSLSLAVEQIGNITGENWNVGDDDVIDLEAYLERIDAIAHAAKAQDDQRTQPERLKQKLKDLRTTIEKAADEQAD